MALSEQGGGGVFNFGKTGFFHGENGGFAGGTEAVLDGTDDFEAAVAVAFEVEYNVDEVFEGFGAGEGAFFGDVADDDNGGVGGFGGANDEVAAVGDLGDAAWGGGDFGDGEGLDGVDDDEVEVLGGDGFGDVVGRGATSKF